MVTLRATEAARTSAAAMSMLSRIRWLRIVVGAIVVEAVLLGIAIPLNISDNGRAILIAGVIPLCVIGSFVGGWWVA